MEDRQGILARVVSTIANLKTNIRQMDTRSGDGKATAELVLEIADLKHLEKVIALDRRRRRRDASGAEVQHRRHATAWRVSVIRSVIRGADHRSRITDQLLPRGFLDLAGADAAGADVHPLHRRADHHADALQIRQPAAAGDVVGVADPVTEHGALPQTSHIFAIVDSLK